MAQSSLNVLEILAGALGGGAITKIVDAIMRGRALKKDEMTAVAEAAELLMGGMRKDLKALRDRLDEVEAKHADCERRCDELTAELRTLKATAAPARPRTPKKDTP
ncbi:MAG: hypothetical protein K2X61_02875 [Caulobacteraceae bacterium]|nr:hypothetical protein [Caulobacteraceae bacterium]